MNRQRKNLIQTLLMVAVMFVGITASAQDGERPQGPPPEGERRGPGQMFERNLQFLVDSVQINKEQQTKVKAINNTYQKKMEKLREEANPEDREAMRTKFQSVMEGYNKEVLAVLTDKQQKQYSEAMERRRKNMESRRPPRPDGESGDSDGRRQRGNR